MRIGKRGATLVELIIAFGLLGGLTLFMASLLDVSGKTVRTAQQGFEQTELVSNVFTLLSRQELCKASFKDLELVKRVEGGIDVYEACLVTDPNFKFADTTGAASILTKTTDALGTYWSYGQIIIKDTCLKWSKTALNADPANAILSLRIETIRRRDGEKAKSFGGAPLGEKNFVLKGQLIPHATAATSLAVDACQLQGFEGGGGTSAVPSKAVMAFNAAACPAGWTEYAPARGKTVIGVNPAAYQTGATAAPPNQPISVRVLGDQGGEETHQLTIAEMPSHNHVQTTLWDGNSGSTILDDFGPLAVLRSGNERVWKNALVQNTGGNQLHNNMQPYVALLYCQKD